MRRTIDESTTTSNVRGHQNTDPTTAGPYPNEPSEVPHSLSSPSENANNISLSQPHFTPPANSPIIADNLEMQLLNHPDCSKVHCLITGLCEGFRVGFHSDNVTLKSAKLDCSSANEHPEVNDKHLAEEIREGRVLGPTTIPPPSLHLNRFGVIPKKNKPNAWRLILDLSFPHNHSVNDGICKNEFPVSCSKVDDAIRMIVAAGKGVLMGKLDVKNAYRIIPIHPADRYLLGMKWRDQFFIDSAFPFRLCSTPCIFNTHATMFKWILQNNYNVANVLHYLDDFFTLGPAQSEACAESFRAINHAAHDIGIPLEPDKCEGPSTCLVYLGIELDSVKMSPRLPSDKLRELVSLIRTWTSKKWCTRKELESLVGKLNHACSVVAPGHTFLRRSFVTLSATRNMSA